MGYLLSGLFASGFFSPVFWLRPLTAVLLAIPGMDPGGLVIQARLASLSKSLNQFKIAFAIRKSLSVKLLVMSGSRFDPGSGHCHAPAA